jgi:hypothetical protein
VPPLAEGVLQRWGEEDGGPREGVVDGEISGIPAAGEEEEEAAVVAMQPPLVVVAAILAADVPIRVVVREVGE